MILVVKKGTKEQQYGQYQKELVLMGMAKHIDKLPSDVKLKILTMYLNDEELELEKNANS